MVRLHRAAPVQAQYCIMDLQTDSQVLIHTWNREGSRSQELSDATKVLFDLVSQRNLKLQLFHISTLDRPSGCLSKSDWMLAPRVWSRVHSAFRGPRGHTLEDLKALDSNAQDPVVQKTINANPLLKMQPTGVFLFSQMLVKADIR